MECAGDGGLEEDLTFVIGSDTVVAETNLASISVVGFTRLLSHSQNQRCTDCLLHHLSVGVLNYARGEPARLTGHAKNGKVLVGTPCLVVVPILTPCLDAASATHGGLFR